MGGSKESQDHHETGWRESLPTHALPAFTGLWKEAFDCFYCILLAFTLSFVFKSLLSTTTTTTQPLIHRTELTIRLRLLAWTLSTLATVYLLLRGQMERLVGNWWIRPLPLIHGRDPARRGTLRPRPHAWGYINVDRLKIPVCSRHTDHLWHSVRRVNEEQPVPPVWDKPSILIPVMGKKPLGSTQCILHTSLVELSQQRDVQRLLGERGR